MKTNSTVTLATVLCAALAACHSAEADKLSAARQALLATGDYQIVAQDSERGLLTVRSRRDGGLQLIDVNAPPTAAPAKKSKPADDAAAQMANTESPAAATASASAAGDAAATANALSADASVAPGEAAVTALSAAEDAGHGLVLAHGPRIHIERVAGPVSPAVPATPAKATVMSGISLNHAVICRSGDRMRLQQVRVISPSVGIVLQPGCQLELIDSSVQSGDVALVVNAGATLRIENSTINGRIGSLQASSATRVSSWASDFSGPTSLDGAEFVDRGGNTWQ